MTKKELAESATSAIQKNVDAGKAVRGGAGQRQSSSLAAGQVLTFPASEWGVNMRENTSQNDTTFIEFRATDGTWVSESRLFNPRRVAHETALSEGRIVSRLRDPETIFDKNAPIDVFTMEIDDNGQKSAYDVSFFTGEVTLVVENDPGTIYVPDYDSYESGTYGVKETRTDGVILRQKTSSKKK